MYSITWKTLCLCLAIIGPVVGFIVGWTYRGRVIANTILKHYYNQDYKKEGNVLYIDKFKDKIK